MDTWSHQVEVEVFAEIKALFEKVIFELKYLRKILSTVDIWDYQVQCLWGGSKYASRNQEEATLHGIMWKNRIAEDEVR